MTPGTNDYESEATRPTEEIYIELRDLEAQAPQIESADGSAEPRPVVSDDDPSGIRARIAHLRAMLSDRGAPYDE